METTSLHLDVLRDLKRIHSHDCSVAYPVLETVRVGQGAAPDGYSILTSAAQTNPPQH